MIISTIAAFSGGFFILWLILWVHRWKNPKCRGKLPPGSMGLPLLGETLEFFSPYTSFDISPFVKERTKRYGPVFKTSLVGRRVVVSTDPELNRFVFQQEGRLFKSWYPETFTEIFGRDNVGELHGFMYKYLKSLVLRLFGPESLREMMLQDMEKLARDRLILWSGQPRIDLKDGISSMIFDLTAKKLIGYDPSPESEDLRSNFVAFILGLISFPINAPGTAYHKCLQGRRKAMRVLKRMLKERRESPVVKERSDFFDCVVEELGRERAVLTEGIALDLMFVLLFASFETTSLALTLAVKLLSQHPAVLHKLKEEHEKIIINRENPESGLTWKEYKSMSFTFQVILETVRLANIVPGIFRKALKDIQINGYTIPAGWGFMVCPPAVHLNPEIYDEPLAFNPWRWKDKAELSGGTKSFMAFGGGMRFCVGADFSKLQMAVFLHCLVTKYRWQDISGGNIIRTPGLGFPDGYHVQLLPK
ncbi:Cytochrome P450 87A3 [Apostasia shenzhenica]|uniref:Cytochrome P450 87A3 n=1 Tax=Apostasia shenzhenica TaxID=1088818 RepID=A0A2H9ZTC9_9ASPA|nr:Cytochrome P450 87A3 [Apostasia shenzhenica]